VITQTSQYYIAIYRDGVQIPQTEYALLTGVTTKSDYFEFNQKTCTLNFGVTNSQTDNNQQDDFFSVMNTYIFSNGIEYKVVMGKAQADAESNAFFGVVTNVSPNFPDDGNITFSVTLENGISGNADANSDTMRSNSWDPNVSAYTVLHDSVKALKKNLLISPQDYATLSSYTHLSGISRPMHQTTSSWLRELANDYGIYLDDRGTSIYVLRLNLKQQPLLYFVYRPTTVEENDAGIIFSFSPDLNKPPEFIGTGVGTNASTGATVAQTSNDGSAANKGPNQYQLTDVAVPSNYGATSLIPNSAPFTVPTGPVTTSSGIPGLGIPGVPAQ
jgi:hypothetical protein